MRFHVALTTLAFLTGTAAQAAPADDLNALVAEHWAWALRNNPQLATTVGDRSGDGQLGDPSLAQMDREAAAASAFIRRLDAIPDAGLSDGDRVNKAVLRRILSDQVEASRHGARAMNFTSYYGWHQGFRGLSERSPFFTAADYESYVRRLEAYPAHNAAQIEVARTALKGGYIQPCAPFGNWRRSITGPVTATPEQSGWWRPFAKDRPAFIAADQWEALRSRARAAIAGGVFPAYRALDAFWTTEYEPRCRKDLGASRLPGGPAYYQSRIREMTTTDMTAEQVHQLGLSEVARIRAEMEAVARKAGFPTREAYVQHLRTDPKYYAKTAQELLNAAAWQAKQIDGQMPRFFGRLPRLPYGVLPIPEEVAPGTTTAFYEAGSPTTGRAGTYRVNTSKLNERPLFELPALTAHEAVPGHHHQIALAQELDLPPFRRHLADFTAFVEGWALYTERLGIEMGLYDTPAKDMGRLSYEMWRACRLVVDTGIHAKGWSKEQAVSFMMDNTALSAANIDAEVNRYISWPGQALAYKVGELKIRELRARAEQRLGPRFELRAFHDTVLRNGAIPLDVLEAQVNRWIEEQAK